MSRFIQCPDCHGVALVIYGESDAGCGSYDKLHANTTEAAVEKHLPVVKVKKDMVEEHGEAGMEVMKKIKDALDPQGLLNKGVLGL